MVRRSFNVGTALLCFKVYPTDIGYFVLKLKGSFSIKPRQEVRKTGLNHNKFISCLGSIMLLDVNLIRKENKCCGLDEVKTVKVEIMIQVSCPQSVRDNVWIFFRVPLNDLTEIRMPNKHECNN